MRLISKQNLISVLNKVLPDDESILSETMVEELFKEYGELYFKHDYGMTAKYDRAVNAPNNRVRKLLGEDYIPMSNVVIAKDGKWVYDKDAEIEPFVHDMFKYLSFVDMEEVDYDS